MTEKVLYDPWTLAVGGPLLTAIIIWISSRLYSFLKNRNKPNEVFNRRRNEDNTTTEKVMPLILVVDAESRNNINFKQLSKVVEAIYKENGYEAFVSSYSRVTGRLEIKNGKRNDIISQLIKKLSIEFEINKLEMK